MEAPLRRSITCAGLSALLVVSLATTAAAQDAGAGGGPKADASGRTRPESQAGAKLKLPETNAGRCVTAFIDMLADATPQHIRAFEMQYRSAKRLAEIGPDDRVVRGQNVAERLGKVTLRDVLSVSTGSIAIAADSDHAGPVTLEFIFDLEQGGKLDGIRIAPAGLGAGWLKPARLSPDERSAMVEAAAEAVAQGYVYPELGRKMAAALRAKLAAGGYDRFDEDLALAQCLTEEMREISHDRHLAVRPGPPNTDGHDGPGMRDMAGDNFAFRKVELLPGNIGYIRFDAFLGEPQAFETASAAMAFLAHCDALIFDLRYNSGGTPESVRYITSYLFDKPTHLNDMIDRSGKTVAEYWTLDAVPGRRFAPDLPVFVLTSSNTFSGAEEFCYNLQNLKRATIVGETTGGGAHPVRGVRVNDRIVVGVPFMRACNPISKTDWEGNGVQPDVKTSSEEALDRAVELAKEAIAARSARKSE
jgi:hypothetical protein